MEVEVVYRGETAEQLSPVGSHQFIDEFNFAYHRAVAESLRLDPGPLLAHARENLSRWNASGFFDEGELLTLSEWEHLLDANRLEELIAIITDASEEGRRLRQFTPFAGVFSSQRRAEILADCEKRASA